MRLHHITQHPTRADNQGMERDDFSGNVRIACVWSGKIITRQRDGRECRRWQYSSAATAATQDENPLDDLGVLEVATVAASLARGAHAAEAPW